MCILYSVCSPCHSHTVPVLCTQILILLVWGSWTGMFSPEQKCVCFLIHPKRNKNFRIMLVAGELWNGVRKINAELFSLCATCACKLVCLCVRPVHSSVYNFLCGQRNFQWSSKWRIAYLFVLADSEKSFHTHSLWTSIRAFFGRQSRPLWRRARVNSSAVTAAWARFFQFAVSVKCNYETNVNSSDSHYSSNSAHKFIGRFGVCQPLRGIADSPIQS